MWVQFFLFIFFPITRRTFVFRATCDMWLHVLHQHPWLQPSRSYSESESQRWETTAECRHPSNSIIIVYIHELLQLFVLYFFLYLFFTSVRCLIYSMFNLYVCSAELNRWVLWVLCKTHCCVCMQIVCWLQCPFNFN